MDLTNAVEALATTELGNTKRQTAEQKAQYDPSLPIEEKLAYIVTQSEGAKLGAREFEAGLKRAPIPGLILKSFPQLSHKLDTIQGGWCVIGAAPNIGKSCLISNLVLDLLTNNPKARVLDFTLDDSGVTRISRYVASLAGVRINYVKIPYHEGATNADRERRMQGFEYFKQITRDRLWIIDYTRHVDDIVAVSAEFYNRYITPEEHLVVVVDAYQNMGAPYTEDLQNYAYMNKQLDVLTRYENLTLITTFHTRKNSERRPTLRDLYGLAGTSYDADAVLLLHSEWAYNPDTSMRIVDEDTGEIVPVVELFIGKNKWNDGRGQLLYAHYKSINKLLELPKEVAESLRVLE